MTSVHISGIAINEIDEEEEESEWHLRNSNANKSGKSRLDAKRDFQIVVGYAIRLNRYDRKIRPRDYLLLVYECGNILRTRRL